VNQPEPLQRVAQVARHLQAVFQDWRAARGAVDRAGSAGLSRLRELGAGEAMIHAFAASHPADRAAATRMAEALRRAGAGPSEEVAALIHDLPKGQVGLLLRIVHVLTGSIMMAYEAGVPMKGLTALRTHADAAPHHARELGAAADVIALLEELAHIERGGTAVDHRVMRLHLADEGRL
jgi:hypothetical protein